MDFSTGFIGQEDFLNAAEATTADHGGPLIMCSPLDRLGEVNVDEAINGMAPGDIYARKSTNWARIRAEMVENGAMDVLNLGAVFKFETWQAKVDAQRAMKASIPWAFFVGAESAAICGVPVGIPTVNAAVITYYSDAEVEEGGGMSTHDDNFFCI